MHNRIDEYLDYLMKIHGDVATPSFRVEYRASRAHGLTANVNYKNQDALNYARQYAGRNENSCGCYFNDPNKKLSDCAHFVAHCLAAGGIRISPGDPTFSPCKEGLAVRNPDIVAALGTLAESYGNVQEIDLSDAIVGDVGFLKTLYVKETHAFYICKPGSDLDGLRVYAHTTNRSCEIMQKEWYHLGASAFRLVDG